MKSRSGSRSGVADVLVSSGRAIGHLTLTPPGNIVQPGKAGGIHPGKLAPRSRTCLNAEPHSPMLAASIPLWGWFGGCEDCQNMGASAGSGDRLTMSAHIHPHHGACDRDILVEHMVFKTSRSQVCVPAQS